MLRERLGRPTVPADHLLAHRVAPLRHRAERGHHRVPRSAETRAIVPAHREMCDQRDAEPFAALPRITLLSFSRSPNQYTMRHRHLRAERAVHDHLTTTSTCRWTLPVTTASSPGSRYFRRARRPHLGDDAHSTRPSRTSPCASSAPAASAALSAAPRPDRGGQLRLRLRAHQPDGSFRALFLTVFGRLPRPDRH